MKPLKILIIDDEAGVRKALRVLLENYGHQVTEATSCEAGLAQLRADSVDFDLIVTDYNDDSANNGLDVVRRVVELGKAVILVTGNDDQNGIFSSLKYARYLYVAKPFAIAVLLEAIEKLAPK